MPFGDKTAVAEALEQTVKLLRSVAASDDELTDAIAGLDRRVVGSLRGYLEVLASSEAICTLESEQLSFRFRDVAQVRNAVDRLADDNIREEEQTFYGELIGNLPDSRVFEFKLADKGEVIKGRIAAEIDDPDALNEHLHQPIHLSLTATRLGRGHVRYVLHIMPDWPASES